MERSEIKAGATYRTEGGRLLRVRQLNGQKIVWERADDPPGAVSSGECSLGRFAARAKERIFQNVGDNRL